MTKTSEREPRAPETAEDRLAGWAESQFTAWRGTNPLDPQALRAQLERVEAASASIFLFDFAAGAVSLRHKTRSWQDVAEPELLRRARHYLALFREVVAAFGLQACFPLAIDVDDHPLHESGVPLLAFQKRSGSPLILLPDIDLLSGDYFVASEYDDPYAFEDKADAAIFVGATTGGNLTRETVEALSMPRLRSAVFFREVADVTFRLPKIVQFDSDDTVAMVRALDVGGAPASWKEQFGYRYLLSMDGNGATCSRVAIALRSHSVLIKYASDFELFYFAGLAAGKTHLAVARDEDVCKTLDRCRRKPDQAAAIARAGRRFALEHLSRLPVLAYVAHLLEAYGRVVVESTSQGPVGVRRSRAILDMYGHIQNVGDVRSELGGWLGSLDDGHAIEGFALEPGLGVDPSDVCYQAVLPNGGLSARCSGYEFCGSRGLNQPLEGVVVALEGAAALDYELTYLVAFSDGSMMGPASSGAVCRSSRGAAMIGLQLRVRPREGGLRIA